MKQLESVASLAWQGATVDDWRNCYDPPLTRSIRHPCGIWFRACPALAAIRMRLLAGASASRQRRN
jgi:hypothetical protein